ncbi:hypothetical protein M0R45_003416 [Rubus argutus]|uniref:Uncharacterized protein n=1 Tax=Rubus argutus TaxID=59490 RepID=A0AAW1YFE1_RUBAR
MRVLASPFESPTAAMPNPKCISGSLTTWICSRIYSRANPPASMNSAPRTTSSAPTWRLRCLNPSLKIDLSAKMRECWRFLAYKDRQRGKHEAEAPA